MAIDDATDVEAFPLSEVGIAELQGWLASGRYTTLDLVRLYSGRVRALDQREPDEPALGHVLELNPAGEEAAARLDAERKAGRMRGPLHGVPLLLKDNIATADAMETTAGSLALLGTRPPRDATVAARLRDAGAIVLGKTNLSEWANFRSTRSTSGWSARGGQTRNPYALDRSPGGSSSGSAVAAAVSSCTGAVGTETSGSIISPANACGVVGLKPTVGLVSRAGIIPIADSQDTAGPLTRCVADAAALLTAMAGSDAADAATLEADAHCLDYTRVLDREGLRGARIGVLRLEAAPRTVALFEEALAVLRERGATLVDPLGFAHPPDPAGQAALLEYEFKAGIERYLAEWAPDSPLRTVEDLIAFNRREAARELPYFGQERLESAARRGSLTSPEYLEIRERLQRQTRTEGIDALLAEHGLDALVAPSGEPARPIDLVNGDARGGGTIAGPPAIAGYPHITVPMGFVAGLPVGLSFVGGAWCEASLLRLAYAYEQATHHRVPPGFAPTAAVPRDGRPL